MVSITIYIEGGNVQYGDSATIQTIDNSPIFRENFHRLFSQKFKETDFNLIVQPIGSVSQAKKYLGHIAEDENKVIFIDLDAPKSEREKRLQSYAPLDTSRLFFMIQEMESWILSQPNILDIHAQNEGFIRKRYEESIGGDTLIKNFHPEKIPRPSNKLSTIFRKYFAIEKMRRGKVKSKPKTYSKTKDGPKLIGLLELSLLTETFDEAANLVEYITAI